MSDYILLYQKTIVAKIPGEGRAGQGLQPSQGLHGVNSLPELLSLKATQVKNKKTQLRLFYNKKCSVKELSNRWYPQNG